MLTVMQTAAWRGSAAFTGAILQVAMSLMTNPPKEGDESYAQYMEERKSIIVSLRERAQLMTDAFNACEGGLGM